VDLFPVNVVIESILEKGIMLLLIVILEDAILFAIQNVIVDGIVKPGEGDAGGEGRASHGDNLFVWGKAGCLVREY
jgi:hypothetical protein